MCLILAYLNLNEHILLEAAILHITAQDIYLETSLSFQIISHQPSITAKLIRVQKIKSMLHQGRLYSKMLRLREQFGGTNIANDNIFSMFFNSLQLFT